MKPPVSAFAGRLRRAGWVWLIALLCSVASPAAAADDVAERERIRTERAVAEAVYQEQVLACGSRFAVTACVDAARSQRHAAMTALDRRQEVLDDAERKQRAAERLQAIESKTSGDEARQREEAARERSGNRRDGDEPKPAGRTASAAAPRTAKRSADPAQRAETEAQARRAFEAKQLQAEAHRLEVLRRNQDRARKANPGVPLPIPAEPAGSAVAAKLPSQAASAAR